MDWDTNTLTVVIGQPDATTDLCLLGYFDWNGDGDFDDTSEKPVRLRVTPTGFFTTITRTITPPAGAVQTIHGRFRLLATDDPLLAGGNCGLAPSTLSRGVAYSGEVEDYTWIRSTTAVSLVTQGTASGQSIVFLLTVFLLLLVSTVIVLQRRKLSTPKY